ncbi:mRNA capping enzyme-domain-containing protein [Schizophyllum commune]
MPAFDPVRDALNSPLSPSHPPPSPFTRPQEAPHYSSSPLASPSIGKRATDLSVLLNDDPPPLTRTPSSRSASLAHLVHQTEPEDKLAYSDPLRRGQSSRDDDGYFAHRPSSSSSRTSLSSTGLFTPSPAAHSNGRPAPQPVAPESPERTSRPSSSSSTLNGPRTATRPTSSHGAMAPPPPPPPPRTAYQPKKRLTPAGSVMIPLSKAEMEQFQHFRGKGSVTLSKRKRSPSREPDEDRPPPNKKLIGDTGVVAAHYNARPEVGVDKRVESPIFALKAFNNWVKSVIITKFAHPALQNSPNYSRKERLRGKVLDLGCGKGGDINKWQKANARHYVGADIAAVSVQQGEQRYKSLRGARPEALFLALDCFTEPIGRALPPDVLRTPFDVVSMQFCMHYAFETEAKARCMLDNVSRYLRQGGIFIGTIPNADFLLSHLDDVDEDEHDLSWGNSVYNVKFDERTHDSNFGHRYWFYLQDAVDNVPEYLVHWDPFVKLAAEYGLLPIYKEPFGEVFQESEKKEFKQLLIRMKVMNEEGESNMTEDQWDAANVYIAFAFKKC